MEIRRNMVPPQVQNKGKITNEQIKDEPKEIQAGETTVRPADVFYTQGKNNNNGNTNGNNGTNNNGGSGRNLHNDRPLKTEKDAVEMVIRDNENRDTIVVDEQGLVYIDENGFPHRFV